jgi:acetyl-CoA carboxylase carboxyl transferase subunit beta
VPSTDPTLGSAAALRAAGGRAAIAAVATDFVELPEPPAPVENPLDWPGYDRLLARDRARTGESDSVLCGTGRVAGTEAVLVSFDFGVLGGSIGRASGDRIEAALRLARTRRIPVVSLLCSGGSRVQEGMLALLQLPRIAGQIAAMRRAGIPHICLCRNPTTGGVWACLGSAADVVLAVSGSQIGFAGSRVRDAADADLPAFTAEGQWAAGAVDAVLDPPAVPAALGDWLQLLRPRAADPPRPAELPASRTPDRAPPDGWSAVMAARDRRRPRAPAYLDSYFDHTLMISGDRCGGRDPGMICGIGRRGGDRIAFAAQAGTPTTAAGYRTARRLVELAERFGLPVLTLVDTPGAASRAADEADGVATAIGDLFATIASASVPITTLVIGEGGSGGALALAAPDRTWITPDAYFSVIAPELAAAILKRRQPDAAITLANQLHLRPADLVALGAVRGVSQTPSR